MKKLNIKLLLLIACLFNTCIALTQFNRVGIRGGVNISNIRIADGNFAELVGDFNNLVGFNVGLLSQASGNGYITSGIGLFYTMKGGQRNEYKLSMHSIQVPLELKIRIPIVDPVYLQLGLGPYISYSFLAKEVTDSVTTEDILSLRSRKEGGTITSGDLKRFNRLDAGFAFGGDVEVKLPNNAYLLVGFNYELGIAKISNDWNKVDLGLSDEEEYFNPAYKNEVMSITITYFFDVTKDKNK